MRGDSVGAGKTSRGAPMSRATITSWMPMASTHISTIGLSLAKTSSGRKTEEITSPGGGVPRENVVL